MDFKFSISSFQINQNNKKKGGNYEGGNFKPVKMLGRTHIENWNIKPVPIVGRGLVLVGAGVSLQGRWSVFESGTGHQQKRALTGEEKKGGTYKE